MLPQSSTEVVSKILEFSPQRMLRHYPDDSKARANALCPGFRIVNTQANATSVQFAQTPARLCRPLQLISVRYPFVLVTCPSWVQLDVRSIFVL